MKKLTKKQIIELAIDAVCVILCIVLLYAAISLIANRYVSWFGRLSMGVRSDSMETPEGQTPKELSFNAGDLIVIDVLSDKEIQQLKVGDVITYWGSVPVTDANGTPTGEYEEGMITHRIIEVQESTPYTAFATRGDKDTTDRTDDIPVDKIIGKVVKVVAGGGKFNLWLNTPAGRFVVLVVPSILICIYVLVMFIMALSGRNKEKKLVDEEALRKQIEDELRAKMAAEAAAAQQTQAPQDNEGKTE